MSVWWFPGFELVAAVACFLVPNRFGAAGWAGPLLFLGHEPRIYAVVADEGQVGPHGPVVGPLVGHEFEKGRAGMVVAVGTKGQALLPGADAKGTVGDEFVDLGAATAGAVLGAAGAAIDAAGSV